MLSSSGSFDSSPDKDSALEMQLGLKVIREQDSYIRVNEKNKPPMSTLHMTEQSFMRKTGGKPK